MNRCRLPGWLSFPRMGGLFLDTPPKMTPKPLVFHTERAGICSSSKEKQKPPAGFCTSLFLFTIQTQLLLILGRDRPGSQHDATSKMPGNPWICVLIPSLRFTPRVQLFSAGKYLQVTLPVISWGFLSSHGQCCLLPITDGFPP